MGFSDAVVHPYFFCLRLIFGLCCGSIQGAVIVRIVVTIGVRSEESCLLWQVSPLPERGAGPHLLLRPLGHLTMTPGREKEKGELRSSVLLFLFELDLGTDLGLRITKDLFGGVGMIVRRVTKSRSVRRLWQERVGEKLSR